MTESKQTFMNLDLVLKLKDKFPTPYHIYDEKGIIENVRKLNKAFSWNPGFREYFAVKATPNPHIMKLLAKEGCGMDCSSLKIGRASCRERV